MLVFYRLFTVFRVLVSVKSSILPLGKHWFNTIHPGVKKVLSSFGDDYHRGIGMSYSKQRYICLIRDVSTFGEGILHIYRLGSYIWNFHNNPWAPWKPTTIMRIFWRLQTDLVCLKMGVCYESSSTRGKWCGTFNSYGKLICRGFTTWSAHPRTFLEFRSYTSKCRKEQATKRYCMIQGHFVPFSHYYINVPWKRVLHIALKAVQRAFVCF